MTNHSIILYLIILLGVCIQAISVCLKVYIDSSLGDKSCLAQDVFNIYFLLYLATVFDAAVNIYVPDTYFPCTFKSFVSFSSQSTN